MLLSLALACYVPDPKLPPVDTDTASETGDTGDSGETGSETGETGETADTEETGETADTEETGTTDSEDCPTVYADGDGDGFGDPAKPEDGCLDTGATVLDNTDCDDADAEVHPGATERCNERDDDCDGDASDGGIVTYTDESGAWSDVSSAFVGALSLDPGTYDVCAGTYAARPSVTTGDVVVRGLGGPIFDASGSGGVFTVTGGSLTIEDLTIQNGVADFDPGYGAFFGGALGCSEAVVDARGVTMLDNSADGGGAVFLDHCDATFTDGELSNNSATAGGAINSVDSVVTLTRMEIADNVATTQGGGIMIQTTTWPSTVDLVDSDVHDNAAPSAGGVEVLYGSTLTCTGSTSATAGIRANTADSGGGVVLYGYGDGAPTFDAVDCDFGTSTGADANTPDDIALFDVSGSYSELGDDATVSCTQERCG